MQGPKPLAGLVAEVELGPGLASLHPHGAQGPLLGQQQRVRHAGPRPRTPEAEVANWSGAEDLEAARASFGV